MAQPTLSGLELDAGSGGSSILHDVISSKVAQVGLVAYSTGDGTLNVVMTDAPLPVDIRADNVGGFEVVQDTAADFNCTEASAASILTDTNAMVVDLAAIEVVLGTIDADTSTLASLSATRDAAAGAADTGIVALAVRQDNADSLVGADGDYSPLTVNEHGCMNIDAQHYYELDRCDDHTDWTALSNDTTGKADGANHVIGASSIEFDKVDGAANTVFAGIYKTVTTFSANKFMEEGGGFILWSMFVSSIANVDYVWIRLGDDASNYNEWQVQDDDLTAGAWNNLRAPLTAPSGFAGNGWNSGSIDYLAVGVAFDTQNNTLANILVDGLFLNSGLQVSADTTAQVSTSIANPNVNVKKWGATNVTTAEGVIDTGTLRITQATDDDGVAHLATIAGDTPDIPNVIGTSGSPGPTKVLSAGGTTAGGNVEELLVDSDGHLQVDILSGASGGTAYTEDVATANPIVGSATMMERDDALAGLTPAEGDWASLRCSAEGALWVQDFNSDAILADTAAMVTDLAAMEALLITIDSDTNDIKTATELLDNAVDGNYLNVNVNAAGTDLTMNAGVLTAQTQRVTIATDDECNNFLGAIDADTSALAAAVGQQAMAASLSVGPASDIADATYIGDIKFGEALPANTNTQEVVGDAAEDAAAAGNPVLVGGRYDTTARTLDNGDVGALAVTAAGEVIAIAQGGFIMDGATRREVKRKSGLATDGTTAIITAEAGLKFRIIALYLKATSATVTNVYLATTTDTDVLGNSGNPIPLSMDADGNNIAGFVLPSNTYGWTQTSTANEALNLVLSAAQDVIYAITYIEVA